MKKVLSVLLLAIAVLCGCIRYQPILIPEPIPFVPTANVSPPFEIDAVTSASPKETSDPGVMAQALSEDGYWILSILSDVHMQGELNVEGTFHDKDDPAAPVYRKLALYAQDANHNVTANYTLITPRINVLSPNFRIQNGTVRGDIYVNAHGFQLTGTILDGNLIFASQAISASADISTAVINGEVSVGN
ncbi:MAG: hypothetical protein LBS62_07570 [Clostridiales bacterium]|jgi:hypothetical protein|nr:hypothetical protein [Clostridiales bacterium]